MKKTKVIKITVISVIAVVLLLSIGKNLNLIKSDNLLVKFVSNIFNSEEDKIKESTVAINKNEVEPQSPTSGKNSSNAKVSENRNESNATQQEASAANRNRIFEGVSKDWYGIKVIAQSDNIESKYYKFIIHKTSTSKKLGEFNYCDDLGHVDKNGNTIDGYSYFVINATIECLKVDEIFGELSLGNLYILAYKDIERKTGHELLTSNNDVKANSKRAQWVKMDKGDKRNFNLVFLVEDEFINDKAVDFYLYINEHGASPGTNDEYKSLVKLDFER